MNDKRIIHIQFFHNIINGFNSILCIKQGMNGFMCEAAIDKTRRRQSAGVEFCI